MSQRWHSFPHVGKAALVSLGSAAFGGRWKSSEPCAGRRRSSGACLSGGHRTTGLALESPSAREGVLWRDVPGGALESSFMAPGPDRSRAEWEVPSKPGQVFILRVDVWALAGKVGHRKPLCVFHPPSIPCGLSEGGGAIHWCGHKQSHGWLLAWQLGVRLQE